MATSMFSRRHYEAVAAILRDAGNPPCDHAAFLMWRTIYDRFATMFEADNPRFDRAKFQEECER